MHAITSRPSSRLLPVLAATLLGAGALGCDPQPHPPVALHYEVVAEYPHDTTAFTQGLVSEQGVLYESTGNRGHSELRVVDLATGRVLQSKPLPTRFFGEGIACLDGNLYQLTWNSGVGLVYDRATLARTGERSYGGEGWGLAEDGTHLIMSDGTSTIRFLDPQTFQTVRQVEVRDDQGPVDQLNELEYVGGFIYSNVWHTDQILKISPQSGVVVGRLHLVGLLRPRPADPEAVLNGIAYDPDRDLFLVTGKRWPKLFAIRISDSEPQRPKP